MTKALFSLFALSILITSCKKDNDVSNGNAGCLNPNQVTPIINADMLNTKYKTGTYWLYTNTVNNQNDSVYVHYDSSGYVTSSYCNYTAEFHEFRTMSSQSQTSTRYAVADAGLFKDFTGGYNTGTCIYSRFEPQTMLTDVSSFDSIYIHDQYYYEVMRYKITESPSNHSFYYVNSDFGILRIDDYSNSALTSQQLITGKNIVR